MKRNLPLLLTAAMSCALAIPGFCSEASDISLNAADYMDQWVYIDQVPATERGQAVLDDDGNPVMVDTYPCYALKNLVYCSNPADASVQILDIYVPTEYVIAEDNGDGTFTCTPNPDAVITHGDYSYTIDTAPIIYQNGIDGYSQANPFSIGDARRGGPGTHASNLESGYIAVSVGSRGRNSEVDGTAPACIVDLKAGVRYLKANDDVLPGDSNKIISSGASAGGSVSALLAASGNSSLYDPYLEESGAVMDQTDDVYGALVFCPIANLEIGDAAFEYLHDGETSYTQGFGPDATAAEFDEFQTALHDALTASYVEYIQELGFDAEEFQDEFLNLINSSIAYYVENYVEDADAFAEENPALTNDNGTFTADSINAFVSAYMSRNKTVPGFDTLDKSSQEAGLFDGEHFSEDVLAVLDELSGEYEDAAASAEEYRAEITEERLNEVKLMSAMTFLTGEEESTIAPFWRFRNGTQDGDLGSIAAFTMAKVLENADFDVESNLIWGQGHCAADYVFEDVQAYIDRICN